jgi:DNA helicase-2/ATP-dependent DNA helicase PcrA
MRPVLVPCSDAVQQARFVARRVLELREEGVDVNRMAVLYRSHFHALELQLELVRHHIPVLLTSGTRFFEQAHIKDVTAYLKLIANPRDELAFKRIVRLLPGIGGKAAEKLWKCFNGGVSAPKIAETDSASPSGGKPATAEARLQACADCAPKKAAVQWAQFVATIAQLAGKGVRGNASKMIRLVIEAGYEDYLKESYDNHHSRLEELEQLSVFARQFADVEEFLTQLALLTNIEAEDDQPVPNDDEKLRLSTIHQAKGLEFDVVFVIMLCDGLFPSERSLENEEAGEEERRLFYVAITRARNELYLVYPLTRAGYGSGSDLVQRPSRFLYEIPKDLLEEWSLRA